MTLFPCMFSPFYKSRSYTIDMEGIWGVRSHQCTRLFLRIKSRSYSIDLGGPAQKIVILYYRFPRMPADARGDRRKRPPLGAGFHAQLSQDDVSIHKASSLKKDKR